MIRSRWRTGTIDCAPDIPRTGCRIAIVVPAFPKLSETFIVNKVLGLLDRGWDVHVVCSQIEREQWCRFEHLDLRNRVRGRVHCTWPTRSRYVAAGLAPLAFARAGIAGRRSAARYLAVTFSQHGLRGLHHAYLDAELIALRPAIIHFEFGSLAVGRTHVGKALNCRIVVSFRGYDLQFVGLEQTDFYDDVWAGADMIHTLGDDLWARAQGRGCPVGVPHTLISPAIDPRLFEPAVRDNDPGRPLRILSVGRLHWKKGCEFALDAVSRLRDADIRFEYRIVGQGAYEPAIQFAINQLDLTRSVSMLGGLDPQSVREQMQWADVFLQASTAEGFCNAVVEAQAMKVPVVTSDADGLAENVEHEVTGFVVPRRNSGAMAGRLIDLARDPELRRRMGEAGRSRAVRMFDLTDQIAKFDAMYAGIIA